MKTIYFTTTKDVELYNLTYTSLFPEDENIVWSSPKFHRIHWLQCQGSCELDGEKIAFQCGDMLLIQAGQSLRFAVGESGFHHTLFFAAVTAGSRLELPLLFSGRDNGSVAALILRLWELLNQPRPGAHADLLARALAQMILAECAAFCHPQEMLRPQNVARLGQELATYPEMPVAAEILARRAGLSPNYLAGQFRRIYGTTLPEFIRLKRIDRAMMLLECTDLSIGAIGKRVGYPDAAHFNKRFRETVGCSPSQYRDDTCATTV